MFVNLLRFKIDEKDGIHSSDISLIEDNLSPLPKGLDRFHIFKDKKKENRFYLIEYWNSIDDMKALEASNEYPVLNRIHRFSRTAHTKRIECDVIV